MYAVYYWQYSENGPIKRLLYASNSGEDGYLITSGKFEKGINMAGSLTVVIPPTNPAWYSSPNSNHPVQLSMASLLSVELVEGGSGKEIWRGRVISQNWDIYRNMTLTCEGILAYLNDVLLPAYNFSWSGIISHAYNPNEGLKFANLDALKDFLPKLTTEGIDEAITGVVENVIGSDSFVPNTDEIYDTITKGLPIPEYKEDGTEVEDNVDRRVSVYDYLVFILTIYNTELTQGLVDMRKSIKIGYVDPIFKTERYLVNHKTNKYTKAWEEISSNILDIYGGVMFMSNWYKNQNGELLYDQENSYLYYYKDYAGESSQVIQYGENLVDFELELDFSETVSRWYVFGSAKDANGKEIEVDMSSVNNGLKYLGIEGLTGTVSKVEYTDLTTPQDCYNRALGLLHKSLFMEETMTVNAIDMNMVDHSIEAFEPGQKVEVIMTNKAYSIGGLHSKYTLRLESMKVDILTPEDSEYVFKNVKEVQNESI